MQEFGRNRREKGNFVEWLLIAVAVSVVIFAFLIVFGLKSRILNFNYKTATTTGSLVSGPVQPSYLAPKKNTPTFTQASSKTVTSAPVGVALPGSVTILSGNAPYTYQPVDEYIVIRNGNSFSINITGWRLENIKSTRAYPAGNFEANYSSDAAIIPQGTKLIETTGKSILEDIVLKPGETALVTTGSPGNLTSYPVMSFKENLCTGYLGEIYRFPKVGTPTCVRPANEPTVSFLDLQCQNYIEGMRSCHKPTIKEDRLEGTVIDGTSKLSGACQDFITAHFNYAGCLAYHRNDANFEGRVWHVYLNKPWELWATSRESISLYDRANRLINRISY